MEHQEKAPILKLKTIIILFFCSILAIILRLSYLQLYLAPALLSQSQRNFTRHETIHSPRGNIVDCQGNLLVTNRPVHNVYWQGRGKKRIDDADKKLLEKLAGIIPGITENETLLTKINLAERSYGKAALATDISFDQLSKLEEVLSADLPIHITTDFKRFYPHGTIGSHIVGYLGTITAQQQGIMGLEKIFEDSLKGKDGQLQKIMTDSFGKSLNQELLNESIAGTTIQTTIDLRFQQIIKRVFPPDLGGTCIIMDPVDGGLLALVTTRF